MEQGGGETAKEDYIGFVSTSFLQIVGVTVGWGNRGGYGDR